MKKLVFAVLALLPAFSAIAQETCEIVVDACADVDAGQVCIDGTQTPLTEMPVIDQLNGDYTVTVLNTSAGQPLATGGVTMLLMGSARLENMVTEGFTPVEPVTVTTTSATNIRTRPGTNHTVLTSVNLNTELAADAISADGGWLRVVINQTPGWIFRDLVTGNNINMLPTYTGDAPLQAFTLTTGDSGCGNDTLVIQALETQTTRFMVNGAEMEIRGTVSLESEERAYRDFIDDPAWFAEYPTLVDDSIAEDAVCRFTTLAALDSDAFLNDHRFSIPRGYRAFAFDCGGEGDILWQRALPITAPDLEALTVLEDLPVLDRTVDIPTSAEVAQISSQIALAMQGNTPSTTTDNTPAVTGDCGGFRPTHPLTGVAFGYVRFYWDPAPGATSYQVNMYNFFEEFIASFSTQGPETSVRVSTMSPQFNVNGTRQPFLSYEVIAYQDGAQMCVTPRQVIQRDYDPDPDCPPSLWFSGTCEDFIANEQ